MSKFFLLLAIGFSFSQSPTENAVLKEAERRNIVTVDQALKTLKGDKNIKNNAATYNADQGLFCNL